jgi:hypothetical protein
MKVLLVGSDFKFGIEQYYKKYLMEQGVEIIHFPAPDIVYKQLTKNVFNKILFKLGWRTGYKKINQDLLKMAEEHKPDLIWIFKGMEIYASTLKELGRNFILVNYNPDHPFIISGPGSGNKNVTGSVGLYQLHFSYNSILRKQIEEQYKIKTAFLPFGYELSGVEYAKAQQVQEIHKICFIGNPGKSRVDTIGFLAKYGFPVDVYGHGWNSTALNGMKGVDIYDAVYGMEFWRKIRQYRVQLNIYRKHNIDSHNMRSFEIPAIGGIQLAPYSAEMAGFFEEGKEIFFFRNEADLLKQAKKLMSADAHEIAEYRQAARDRSVNSSYSYRDRAVTVYENFKILLGK